MSATLLSPRSPAEQLHDKMLADGWSPEEIRLVEGALISVRLHDAYLVAGYSPDEIEQLVSLY